MGRDRTNPSRSFFSFNQPENKNTCNICNMDMKGNHAGNLERHLKRHHNIEFTNLQQKKMKLNVKDEPTQSTCDLETRSQVTSDNFTKSEFFKVKLNREIILKGCVELITLNGCSFELFDYSGFKKILNPIADAMGNNFSADSFYIKLKMSETALKIVDKISKTLRKKMICLKIDTATRQNKSILGINVQLVIGGKINLFTLGMEKLKAEQTGIFIKNTIETVLCKYNIDAQQIYSIVTDNGVNMIKFDEPDKNTIENKINNCLHNEVSFPNSEKIECLAHILQLTIKDSIKEADLINFISEARELVKKLRVPSLETKFKNNNIKIPVLDCNTKWNSTYNMLKSLLDCKKICLTLGSSCFSEEKWTQLNLIVDALQPLTNATLKLQREQLTLSDFFGLWLESKIKLISLKNFFADILQCQMSNREISLLENETLLGAVYLDPRFQILLNISQKMKAVQHLKTVWNRLESLKKKAVSEKEEKPIVKIEKSEDDVDDLEYFLRNKELAMQTEKGSHSTDVDIEYLLRSFENVKRVERKKNILDFWEENKNIHTHLYNIAMVVLAVPSTQVSVERAFSGLKFILGENRNGLDRDTLEHILIIRSNFDLF